jgi:hypothetical protein
LPTGFDCTVFTLSALDAIAGVLGQELELLLGHDRTAYQQLHAATSSLHGLVGGLQSRRADAGQTPRLNVKSGEERFVEVAERMTGTAAQTVRCVKGEFCDILGLKPETIEIRWFEPATQVGRLQLSGTQAWTDVATLQGFVRGDEPRTV